MRPSSDENQISGDMVLDTEPLDTASRESAGEPIVSRWWRTLDKVTLVAVLVLFAIGLLLGLAASVPLAERNGLSNFYYVRRQAVFGGMGLLTMLAFSMMSPILVRRLSVIGFVIIFISLLLLPIFGTDFGKSATRWYSFGFISLQPSEFVKPVLIVVSAWLIAASQEINGPPGRLLSFLMTLSVAGLLVIQPDFGQTALILFGWGVLYFVAGAPIFLVGALIGVIGAGALVAYNASEHFARRINGYLSADIDPRSQIGYATNAIQEGGFWGVGIGEGQVKWILPDAHTDFIIAVAAEEYGLILVSIIILCYAIILLRSLFFLLRERDIFVRLAGTGLVSVFVVQAMINMGVAVRLLPAKGMTLPFISYGGSSLIAAGAMVGMLLAMTRRRPQGHIGDILRQNRDDT